MNNLNYLDELPERVDNPNFPRIPEPTPETDPFKDLTPTEFDGSYAFDWDEEFKEKAKKPKNFEAELNELIDSFDVNELPSEEELGLTSI